ncbi:MAG: flagellar hook-length control protein FliK [Fusobacteriota bacterium]
MKNLIRLNFKKLIPTISKKKEIFTKLKIGDIVKAKVMDQDGKKTLLNIKGTDVLTDIDHKLTRGEVIKLEVQKFKEEKILVKMRDHSAKKELNFKNPKNKNLKKAILSESIKSKTFLKESQINRVVKKYNELNNKLGNLDTKKGVIKKDIIRALIIIEGNDLDFSEELFKNIRAYLNHDIEKKKKINKDDSEKFKEDLKSYLKNLKESKNPFDKGLKIMNAINKEKKQNILEFMFLINKNLKPVEIKIRYPGKKGDEKIDYENSYIDFNLELENIGELKISFNSWKKKVEITFWTSNKKAKDVILKDIDILKQNIEDLGYKIDGIKIKNLRDEIKPEIKGVNVKA